MSVWKPEEYPITKGSISYVPDINIGRSAYHTTGPVYVVSEDVRIKGLYEARMFLGNCGWYITGESSTLFDTQEEAKKFCENHARKNFKLKERREW